MWWWWWWWWVVVDGVVVVNVVAQLRKILIPGMNTT